MLESKNEEMVNFTATKLPENDGWIVKTDRNPYIMVGRLTKVEAYKIAFEKFIEKITEIEDAKQPTVVENTIDIINN